MKQIITILLLILISTELFTQTPPNKKFADAVKINYGFELPFSVLSDRIIPDIHLSYFTKQDYQMKEYYDSKGEKSVVSDDPYIRASFKIPNSNLWVCSCYMEINPCCGTEALLLIDYDGRVWDELYVTIENDIFATKQFMIDSNMDILVYSIESAKHEPIDLWTDNDQFTGYRQDCVYRVQDKKFVLVSTKRGPDRLIKSSDFKPGQLYLWDPFWAI